MVSCTSKPKPPQLTAKQSNYTQTSTYKDVMEVVSYAQKHAKNMHYEVFGHSELGKNLPLLVFSDRVVETPKEAHTLNRPIVFIMANIHGGEVEGKEALLRLILELTKGTHQDWLNKVTLMLAPIYNADGNDKISNKHRVHQNGPSGGMGTRTNAKGLDLNRDMMKLASSEARALVQNILAKWNPALFMDLHTTDGSPHGYHLTYAVPLNPNTDPAIVAFQRQTMMPAIQKKMKQEGWNVFSYGNFWEKEMKEGYYTYSPQPRYTTNYIGLRNRLGLLSEAYSYLGFEQRIAVTEDFVKSTIQFMAHHADSVQALLTGIQKNYTTFSDTLQAGISYDFIQDPRTFNLLVSDLDTVSKKFGEMYKRMGIKDTVTSKLYNQFRITEQRAIPYAYAIDNRSGQFDHILENLSTHGIKYFTDNLNRTIKVKRFEVTKLDQANERYQHVLMNDISGKFHQEKISLKGWIIIPTTNINRPLIFQLLEPEAEDGYATWNMYGINLETDSFPVVKVPHKTDFTKK